TGEVQARGVECFAAFAVSSVAGPTATVRAHEETLFYLIEPQAASDVLATGAGLTGLSKAIQRVRGRSGSGGGDRDLGLVRVESLIHRPPVTFPAGGSAAEAAALMARDRLSSLLIPWRDGVGILTDRDLRSR